MSAFLFVALGALIAYAGVLLGIARERGRKPEPTKAPEPICGCEHELAMHDLKTGQCHDQARLGKKFDGAHMIQWHWVPCKCRQYTGPRPIDQVFLPPTYLDGESS